LRGLLLVAIGLVVYDFIAGSEAFAFVDDSQSSKIFASIKSQVTGEIADQETALQWLTTKFEGLMEASCGASSTDA
jgi:membrane protein required for colicin V production